MCHFAGTSRPRSTDGPVRRRAAFPAAAAAAVALSLVAGCGSSATDHASDAAALADSSGLDSAMASVARQTKPLDAYPVPTEKLSGVSALKGRTVYYVPISRQAPQFAVTGAALKKALGTVGISLRICNGNSDPTQVSVCVDQAVDAGAGAVITDSIPYALAVNAFEHARAKDIPVLITDQIADATHPADRKLGYLDGAGRTMLTAVADWVIADSKGKAEVVINQSTDSPSSIAYVEAAQQEFGKLCSACKVVINKISSADFSLIASSTSSTLLRNPGTGYVISEFDHYLQSTLGGVQQSGRSAAVKGGSAAAQISGLRMLRSKNFLHVDVGQASAYQGWADADAALRLMLGQRLPAYIIPIRLFTRENVADLKLTGEAEASGEWFGPTDFPSHFAGLWGAE